MNAPLSLDDMMERIAESLLEDIYDYLPEPDKSIVQNIEIGFLPLGSFDAFCSDEDAFSNRLDGYVIALNEGLNFGLRQLFIALIQEEMRGDFKEYQCDGSEAFAAALRFFRHPHSSLIGAVDITLPTASQQGEIDAYISSVQVTALRFIALHEVGHLILGHLGQEKRQFHDYLQGNTIEEGSFSPAHSAEYAADDYAINVILQKSTSHQAAIAAAYVIYLSLLFLAEAQGPSFSQTHPPTQLRAERIRHAAETFVGESSFIDGNPFKRATELMEKWREVKK